MSEHPDQILLEALESVAKSNKKSLSGALRKILSKPRNLGDLTMVFMLEGGGIPLLCSTFIPWNLVWESLTVRLRRIINIPVGSIDTACFGPPDEPPPQKGLCLQDLEEAIVRLTDRSGSRRPIITVECGPCFPYTLQLIVCCGGLCGILKTRKLDLGAKYELGWTLAEASMITHYCAARIGVPADRLIFTGHDCFVKGREGLGRKNLRPAGHMRQPKLCFGRLAKSSRDCRRDDIFVSGYMRTNKSCGHLNEVGCSRSPYIKRAMSVGAMARESRWRVGFGNLGKSTPKAAYF